MLSDVHARQAVDSMRRSRQVNTAHDVRVRNAHDSPEWDEHQHVQYAYDKSRQHVAAHAACCALTPTFGRPPT